VKKCYLDGNVLSRKCLLKLDTEGKLERRRGQGRRDKQLLDVLREKKKYCYLNEEALDHILWRSRFRIRYGPVARQNKIWTCGKTE